MVPDFSSQPCAKWTTKRGGLNRSVQHHLIGGGVMRQGRRYGLSAVQKAELWRLWRAGESLHEIGRALDKSHSSIQFLLLQHGGIAPAMRHRSQRVLTLAEREDISRGLASGLSIREIARGLQRAASTVSREVVRNGGRSLYRASEPISRPGEQLFDPSDVFLPYAGSCG